MLDNTPLDQQVRNIEVVVHQSGDTSYHQFKPHESLDAFEFAHMKKQQGARSAVVKFII